MTSLPSSIRETAAALRKRTLTCEALVHACLQRIREVQPTLKPFITVLDEQAIAAAKALDAELAAGKDRGLLHGIPIVHKDLFDTAGVRTTAGSRLFESRTPGKDAAIVRRLAEAGAVTLGKTNMNELAAGSSGRNVFYGDVRNPWDTERSPGGSSSGTVAAIAAGVCLAGTGSDTGGSIRIPAACTGLVGLRPGFARLPLEGVLLRSYSLDTIGPIARRAEDCALLFGAMSGFPPGAAPAQGELLRGLRIGLPKGIDAHAQGEARGAFERALKLAAQHGARAQPVGLPELLHPDLLACAMDVMLYEFYEILGAQYRGCERPETLFGPVPLSNLRRGSRVAADRYQKSFDTLKKLSRSVREALREVDVLALPTLGEPAPLLDAPGDAFDRQREFTMALGATGLPIIAIPSGRDAQGMPLGIQLVANDGGEEALLALAAAFEPLVGWADWRPEAFSS